MDEQYCQVKFESFGFTNKQVIHEAGFLQKLLPTNHLSYFCSSDPAGVDGGVAKQCEPKYLTCTIWLQVRTHLKLSKQGHWNPISGMYKTLLKSKVHSQGHIDGCLLHRLLWHILSWTNHEGDFVFVKLNWEQKQNMTCLGLKNKSELNLCLQIVNSGGSLSMTAMFS